MSLNIGIIGLPNVGKSTLFNALTKSQKAETANYPFCTIEPNKAIVPVPDQRVESLREIIDVPNAIHAVIEFVDIAGLVQGASKGEGLGNQFLSHIRNTDALIHIVRCFEDPNIVYIRDYPNPEEDIEIVNIELMLADLQSLERKIERLSREVKGDKKFKPLLEKALLLQAHLQTGKPVSFFEDKDLAYHSLNKDIRFLSGKPIIYAANVDESGFSDENHYVQEVRSNAKTQNAEFMIICAKLEEELIGMDEEEQQEFFDLVGIKESGLDQIIKTSYRLLGLISFFTMNENEVRAWTIPQGWKAPRAAGVIHTDFEKGFVKAETISYETFAEYGSIGTAKEAGEVRIEGKDYIVKDGDVIYFRFNV